MYGAYGKGVLSYALQDRPTNWGSPTIDLNFSYRICLEIAKHVFSTNYGDWFMSKMEMAQDEEKRRREQEIATMWEKWGTGRAEVKEERKPEKKRNKLKLIIAGIVIIILTLIRPELLIWFAVIVSVALILWFVFTFLRIMHEFLTSWRGK